MIGCDSVKNIFEKRFKLEENKTNIRTEILAGITTFMSMSYIIFLNPTVLSQTGMDYNAVYAATIIASIIATLVMAFYANVPYALSTGIGLGSLFTYTIYSSYLGVAFCSLDKETQMKLLPKLILFIP